MNSHDNYYENKKLSAEAEIQGSPLAPALKGTVLFKDVYGGVMVFVRIFGLPPYTPSTDNNPPIGPHGFHIHETGNCEISDMNVEPHALFSRYKQIAAN